MPQDVIASGAVEDTRSHERTVPGEGERQVTGKLQAGEVVTDCDLPRFFIVSDLENKTLRRPLRIAFVGPVFLGGGEGTYQSAFVPRVSMCVKPG